MPDRNDAQLETLLREHFAAKLDGQVGRAAERFLRRVADQPPAPRQMRIVDELGASRAAEPLPRRSGWSAFGWSLGIAGAAVAAGIAVVMVLAPMLTNHRPANPVIVDGGSVRHPRNGEMHLPSHAGNDDAAVEPVGPQNVEHALAWRTVDQGTVYLGGGEVPLRSVVRQADETVRWYDPRRKAQVELTVPRNEVMLVEYGSQ